MKRVAFFLILLLIWAQVDDAWVSAPVSLSASFAQDDEYLPVESRREDDRSAQRQRPVLAVRNAPPGHSFSSFGGSRPSGSSFAAPFQRSSVYVFMSLRR
jgi:hypothetical protein